MNPTAWKPLALLPCTLLLLILALASGDPATAALCSAFAVIGGVLVARDLGIIQRTSHE